MKLSAKFLLPTVLLIAVGMVTLTLVSFASSQKAIEELVTAHTEQLLDATINNYQKWLASRHIDLDTWAHLDVCVAALDQSFLGLSARQSLTEELTRLKKRYGYYQGIFLADRHGNIISSSNPEETVKAEVAEQAFFKQALAGEPAISRVFRDPFSKVPVFVMAVPIRTRETIDGVLYAEIDVINLNDRFIDQIKIGQSGRVIIFDNQSGLIISHPDHAKILSTNIADFIQDLKLPNNTGHIHTTETEQPRCVTHSILKELGWKFIINVSTEELYGPIKKIRTTSLILTLTMIPLACLIIFFISQRTIIKPIQKLQVNADRLAHGDLEQDIETGRDDELGSLAKSFAMMRDAIKKQLHELQNTHAELEKKVKERTSELQNTHEQLLHAEKLSAIGRLSASIAHEFNNPLYGVINVIRGIKRRATLDKEDDKLIGMALKECNRMKNFIKDLQDFNRPTSGQPVLTDIHQAIDAILLITRKDLKNKKITVTKNYGADIPKIHIVVDQIKQVLLNLLNNAADACEGDRGKIKLSTELQKNDLIIRVQDNGKGIKPEDLDNVFEPFFTTKPEVKGIGLGLSVSYGIIKKHGGKIKVESTPGEGTTFSVILPLEGKEHAEQVNPAG